jgi:ribonuclease HI
MTTWPFFQRNSKRFEFKFLCSKPLQAMSEEAAHGILGRRMNFCESLTNEYKTPAELYITCDHCSKFLCICCQHLSNPSYRRCHHYPIVFVDGACSGNGTEGAFSGIGGLFGDASEYQWSLYIDQEVDAVPIRTSQRAELLAAIEGVTRLENTYSLSSGSLSPEAARPNW